jgi:vacuolar-type H+-ATPase subunit E/Vma4
MLDRVFHAAEERLAEISTSEAYAARLGDQLSEAISYLATPAAVVRCPPALASRVRALIAGQDRLSVEEEEKAEPGFVLLAADGSLEVEGTLTARLTRLRPFLGIEILDRVGADA